MLRICFLVSLVSCQQFTGDELQSIFGSKKCILGSLSNINLEEGNDYMVKDSKNVYQNLVKNVTLLENQKEEDKSVLSKLNEFAQYNELDYYFKLEKEEGPAHDKTFTISLNIGEEKYVADGQSIKKAQKNAASLLFDQTKYTHVPLKDSSEKIDDSVPPTMLLNNVCAQLGIKVDYSVVDNEHELLKSNLIVTDKSKKSYIQKLNDSLYSDKNVHIKRDLPNTKGPFTVELKVGDNVFYGSAHSIKAARHDAATKAIDFLLKNRESLYGDCMKEGSEEQCKKNKQNIKSPTSLAHEAAQVRGMNMNCEVIDESGPAHRKTFVTECKIGDLTTKGEAKSKKESKRVASEEMLQRLDELPPISKDMQIKSLMNMSNKKKNKKKKNVIKNSFEEISLKIQSSLKSTFQINDDQGSNEKDASDSDDGSTKQKKKGKPKFGNQFQDEVLKFSGLLGFRVSYSDFYDKGHFSLLSLQFNPEHLCLGQGLTANEARNKAANGALNLLYNLNFKTHFEEKHSTLESNIKASIRTLLQGDHTKDTTDHL